MNRVKLGLAGLLLSSAIAFPSASQKPKYIDELIVNNDTTYRTIIQKSEKEGIQDMRKLVKESEIEEAWVYLPNWDLWHEVGKVSETYDVSRGRYTLQTRIDAKYIEKLISQNKNIKIYHFHPDFAPEEALRIMSKQNIDVQTSLPSPQDINVGIGFGRIFSEYYPEDKIEFVVVSEKGISNFYLTPEGKKKYGDWTNFGIERFVVKQKFEWTKDMKKSDEDLIEKIKSISEIMSDDYVKVDFKTYEEYFSESNK